MKKSVLGKGLGALISSSPRQDKPKSDVTPQENGIMQLPLDQIKPNRYQPRREFLDEAIEDLANSIKEKGVITPILVRRAARGYEIIAGERRFRASQKAGLKTIPVLVRDTSDEEALEIALIENIQREDLNPIEEAKAYKQLCDQFKLTHEEAAKRVGKQRSTISNSLRLLELPDSIQMEVSRGTLSMGHARCLLSLNNQQQMEHAAKIFINKEYSVRQAENYIQNIKADKTPINKDNSNNSNILDLENKLRLTLGTKVKVNPKGKGGNIVIAFGSLDELDRILSLLKVN